MCVQGLGVERAPLTWMSDVARPSSAAQPKPCGGGTGTPVDRARADAARLCRPCGWSISRRRILDFGQTIVDQIGPRVRRARYEFRVLPGVRPMQMTPVTGDEPDGVA